MLGAARTESGKLFRTVGTAHANRREAVTVREGTLTSWSRVDERSERVGLHAVRIILTLADFYCATYTGMKVIESPTNCDRRCITKLVSSQRRV